MAKAKIAIVGFSQTSRHLAPYDSDDFEIWGCNHVWKFVPRVDALFELHTQEMLSVRYGENWPAYSQWMSETDIPIYMADHYEKYPTSIKYPLEQMKERFPFWEEESQPCGDRIEHQKSTFKSTISYMMALAIADNHVKQINIYGVDMIDGTEWGPQRPDLMRFIGHASERGIRVVLSSECALMKEGGFAYYAYDEMHQHRYERVIKEFQKRRDHYAEKYERLRQENEAIMAELQHREGAASALETLLADSRLDGASTVLAEHLQQARLARDQLMHRNHALVSEIGATDGALQECHDWLRNMSHGDRGWP